MPSQAKWSLPICVQTPLTALWRALVPSTLTQAASVKSAHSTLRAIEHAKGRFSEEAVPAGDQQPHHLTVGDADPNGTELRLYPPDGDLSLMVLGLSRIRSVDHRMVV